MIVDGKRSWIRLLLSVRGTVLPRIWVRLTVTVAASVVMTALHARGDLRQASLTPLPFTLMGLALGIFLGFRNNTSYDRFWEGRKLWGGVVNATRSLCRKTLTLMAPFGESPPSDEQRAQVLRIAAFAHALRLHLRDQRDLERVAALLPAEDRGGIDRDPNLPAGILLSLGRGYSLASRAGRIDPVHLPAFEGDLAELTALAGGCERIKNTPIPFSYSALIHGLVAFYCFGLPFGIADTVGMTTPLVVALVAYAFFGLDAIGEEIEEPFGEHPNDLPLLQLSTAIEAELRARVGESVAPVPRVASGVVL